MAYLVRVRIPDRPGALGRLAAALGSKGVDIESLVVIDRADGEAVDDLIVSLPPPGRAEALVTAVTGVEGATLETIQPHPGRARVHDELELLDAAALSRDPIRTLVAGLPDLFTAAYALAVRLHGGRPRVMTASVAAPGADPTVEWLPLTAPRHLDVAEVFEDPLVAGPDCSLIAVPLRTDAAILLARNGGAEFRPSELLRLAHLTNVLARAHEMSSTRRAS